LVRFDDHAVRWRLPGFDKVAHSAHYGIYPKGSHRRPKINGCYRGGQIFIPRAQAAASGSTIDHTLYFVIDIKIRPSVSFERQLYRHTL